MISLKQLELLEYAVSEAEDWRGSLIGAAPFEAIEAFDKRIRDMKKALVAARETRNELLAIKRERRIMASKLEDAYDYKIRENY